MPKPKQLMHNLASYGTVISICLFVIGAIFLSFKLPGYSLYNSTISEAYKYSGQLGKTFITYMFICKFFLDIMFSFSIFRKLSLKTYSGAAFVWLVPVISFGLLGFVTVSNNPYLHNILATIMLLSWFVSQIVYSKLTGNQEFVRLSRQLILLQIAVGTLFILFIRLNGFLEIVYFLFGLLWVWHLLLVLDLR